MLVRVYTHRTFTAGALAGMTIPQDYYVDASVAPRVGDTINVEKALGSSPYTDTVKFIEEMK